MSADTILDACARGEMALQVALMHLAAEAPSEAAFHDAIRAAGSRGMTKLCALVDDNPDLWDLTRQLLNTVDHDSAPTLERLAAMFDTAVGISPAGSVALYSLGNEAELARATDEIVMLMEHANLLGQDKHVLDLGCGIGRVVAALAPHAGHITGLDISAGMIEEARRRCSGIGNVSLAVTSGKDLAAIADRSMDVILAADVFPYLVQISLPLAQAHLCEAARILRPNGALLILNFSYRADPDRDAADLASMTADLPLSPRDLPDVKFRGWDAAVFLFRKRA